MAGKISNLLKTIVLVCAGLGSGSVFGSALSDLANSMSPGTWAELSTNGFNNGDILYTTKTTPGNIDFSNTIVDYAESAAWDPVSRKFLFMGAPHGAAWKFIIYSEATNTWTSGPLPQACMENGSEAASPGCGGHAFDFNSIDVASGEFIWRYLNAGPDVYKYNISANTWSTYPSVPSNHMDAWTDEASNKFGALEWFPERNGFISVAGGYVFFYHNSTQTWERLPNHGMGDYENFAEYNPFNKVVIFGGGNSGSTRSSTLYKMDMNGTVTQLNDAPIEMLITASSEKTYGTLVTVDPVSGKYLVLHVNNTLYEYDVGSDSWATVGTAPIDSHSVATPISNYGVVMFVSTTSVYLYKHNACVSCPPPEPPVAPVGINVDIQVN